LLRDCSERHDRDRTIELQRRGPLAPPGDGTGDALGQVDPRPEADLVPEASDIRHEKPRLVQTLVQTTLVGDVDSTDMRFTHYLVGVRR
jgi:hypothetical protein